MRLRQWFMPFALAGVAVIGSTASAAQWVKGPGWDVPRSGKVIIRPPGASTYPPGHLYPKPGKPVIGPGQGWIGVPGLDAGYDRWRREAEKSYRRGDFHIQGWKQKPYPYLAPRYPYNRPGTSPHPYPWSR